MKVTSLNVIALFVIAIVVNVFGQTARAYYLKNQARKEYDVYLFNSFSCLLCLLFIPIFNGFNLNGSLFSIISGMIFGAISACGLLFTSLAINKGPWSYSNVIIYLSTGLTALSGAVFFGEKLSYFKIAGIVLMIVCFILSVDTNKKDEKKASFKWLILVSIAFIFTTLVGFAQKFHQESDYKAEINCFLMSSFVVSTLSCYIIYLVLKFKDKESSERLLIPGRDTLKSILVSGLIFGITYAFINVVHLYLSGVVDSAIFFPLVNGVPLILSLIFAFLFFKEKMSLKQVIGIVIGVIAIALLVF